MAGGLQLQKGEEARWLRKGLEHAKVVMDDRVEASCLIGLAVCAMREKDGKRSKDSEKKAEGFIIEAIVIQR